MFDRDNQIRFPMAWAMPRENNSLRIYLNSWLDLQKTTGRIDELYNYWILGKNAKQKKPRWSIIRNVLHWVN